MKSIFLPIIATICFILIVGFLVTNPDKLVKNGGLPNKTTSENIIKINDLEIKVILADNPEKREKGLSKKENLEEKEGMFFVFDKKDTKPNFWMKGMLFPIDIIWINDEKIVQIDKSVPIPSENISNEKLIIYSPNENIDYALEVNAGFSQKYNLKVNDSVDLSSLSL